MLRATTDVDTYNDRLERSDLYFVHSINVRAVDWHANHFSFIHFYALSFFAIIARFFKNEFNSASVACKQTNSKRDELQFLTTN